MKGTAFVYVYGIVVLFILSSCTASGPGLFGKQNLHDQYAQKLANAGLKETAIGRLWFSAAEQALSNPVSISLPYKEISYFAADKPRAVGLQFSGKQGEKLVFQIKKNPSGSFILYADLWEINPSAKPSFIRSIDTAQQTFELEIDNTATQYLLRLQPELLRSMDYELSIAVAPSLAFPVAGSNARIASIWGDARDAGARKHEGIDIFAPKRTPALAAEDGTVTRVNENNLGGRVVWLRPKNKNYTLYYAHLDEQLATDGQRVSKGDTIGLIGNTGNARSTPPHLHFGIYSMGGAVDPLPFVNPSVKNAGAATSDVNLKEEKLRLVKNATLKSGNFAASFPANTIAEPVAATEKTYRVVLPNGMVAEVDKALLQLATKSIKQATMLAAAFLLDHPSASSARKKEIEANSKVAVLGAFENFQYVRYQDEEGWLPNAALK